MHPSLQNMRPQCQQKVSTVGPVGPKRFLPDYRDHVHERQQEEGWMRLWYSLVPLVTSHDCVALGTDLKVFSYGQQNTSLAVGQLSLCALATEPSLCFWDVWFGGGARCYDLHGVLWVTSLVFYDMHGVFFRPHTARQQTSPLKKPQWNQARRKQTI